MQPYPGDLLIATKIGAHRGLNGEFLPHDTPAAVRAAVEHDLQGLGVGTLDLVHARRMPNSPTPFTDTVGALADLRDKGLVRAIGVSNVDLDLLVAARTVTEIASVENHYSFTDQSSEPVLAECERLGIAFLPFHLLGDLTQAPTVPGATPAQAALAWLLRRSPVVAPIPGTASLKHLTENLAARNFMEALNHQEAASA